MCKVHNVAEVTSVFKLFDYRCIATGKVFKPTELTLIRLKEDKPLGVTNAVPVHRTFARHHPVLPVVFAKNVERFKAV
jgi:hypothetical protein